MNFRRRKALPDARPEITPLIDVLFILNMFFMLSAQTVESSGFKLNLPRAFTASLISPKQVEISVNDLDQIFLSGERLDAQALRQRLASLEKTQFVLIRADRESSYGRAMEIFDLLRQLDFQNLSLAMRPAESFESAVPPKASSP
ncbi:MAG: biopolymer transporter ExbD [Planctomycetes bacterium]|nr:biopolymer transporter ExbD [Planctomycetota bacterium]